MSYLGPQRRGQPHHKWLYPCVLNLGGSTVNIKDRHNLIKGYILLFQLLDYKISFLLQYLLYTQREKLVWERESIQTGSVHSKT